MNAAEIYKQPFILLTKIFAFLAPGQQASIHTS
jgi:hypothetical protein